MKLRLLLTSSVLLLVLATSAEAQSVGLAWDRNPESDVAGYLIQFGNASRQYNQAVDVGSATEWRVRGLLPDRTYYFAVRAYSRTGLMGPPSGEVVTFVPGHPRGVDFSGDGHGDILWQNYRSGGVGLWRMRGVSAMAGVPLGPGWVPDTSWKIVGAHDFDRDGDADVLWQNDNGHVSLWYMQGEHLVRGEVITQTPVPAGWRVVATGDLDSDGRPDILWQHTDGTFSVWYMNGAQMRTGVVINRPSNAIWRVVGASDFDRDGWLDVLWRNNNTGQLAIWFLRDRQLVSSRLVNLTMADLNWQVSGLADFNSDGRPDLIWRHRWNGGLATWLMNGTTVLGGYLLNPSSMDNDWVVAGPR